VSVNFLDSMKQRFPQTSLNGLRNMWIVKPGGSSRGRDIKVFNKLSEILHYTEIDVGVL
jgi:tubulin monoglycylase TTLL3/8